ncbi:manganese efflux pump MntP family protein [Bianquea renquensis]|jgi:UPF0059 membrane protein ccel_1412|uniref:Putative manganese efflux pump MntP n=1 Tax=Bianquea renquensis TaxID=2763661 RepID=A0A926DRU9_9FIRM|nr:manganese efflux pump MntP family protein [Bianquea renquensis]MBC8542891.1 manganese efflux pump [Bianquea renquensis]
MSVWEVIMIGIGLSMDAAAVSMTNGMVYPKTCRTKILSMPLFFGGFQALMPLLGYYASGVFADFLSRYSGIIVLIILGVIGCKMVYDGLHPQLEEETDCSLTYRMLLLQAVATSIDAFAVGVGFSAMQVNIVQAVSIIGVTTLVCSFLSIAIGKKFGNMLGNKAQILGGMILIIIGIKGMFG